MILKDDFSVTCNEGGIFELSVNYSWEDFDRTNYNKEIVDRDDALYVTFKNEKLDDIAFEYGDRLRHEEHMEVLELLRRKLPELRETYNLNLGL